MHYSVESLHELLDPDDYTLLTNALRLGRGRSAIKREDLRAIVADHQGECEAGLKQSYEQDVRNNPDGGGYMLWAGYSYPEGPSKFLIPTLAEDNIQIEPIPISVQFYDAEEPVTMTYHSINWRNVNKWKVLS